MPEKSLVGVDTAGLWKRVWSVHTSEKADESITNILLRVALSVPGCEKVIASVSTRGVVRSSS